jgi:uncharacterized OsmC-like protein
MTTLAEYLIHKRDAFRALRTRILASGYEPTRVHARVTAEGRSGVRRVRLRDHQVLTDSPRDFVGYDLGPSAPELALGALGSCLTHSYLIQAAVQGVALDSLEVEVTGQVDQRAGEAGHEATPREPHGIAYTVHIGTSAPDDAITALHEAVERLCPILNLLRNPQLVIGAVRRTTPASPATRALSPEGVA